MSVPGGMLDLVTATVASPVFIGRGDQLAELDDAYQRAVGAEPTVVLVPGEAGVGKTRLLREFAARVRTRQGQVLTGGCLELGTDHPLPYSPFVGVLRSLARELGPDVVSELVPRSRELAQWLPELPGPTGQPDLAAPRNRLFEEFLVLLERLGEQRPTVVVVEDAHWADPSTRDLLTFLTRNLRSTRVLVVVTYRSDDLHRRHPLRALIAELDRLPEVRLLPLPRLTLDEVAEQAAAILGREVGTTLVQPLFERSEGNPLFVEALVCCECDGELVGALSDSLRDLLLRAVEQLPEVSRRVLGTISGSGTYVGHSLLVAVSDLDEESLADALRPAVERNVLIPERDGYAFRHALLAEAVHDELLPGEHRRLHAAYAQALDRDPSLVPAGQGPIERAHHWYSAHAADRALAASWTAAQAAAARYAYAEQLQQLDRVVELWDQVSGAATALDTDRVGLLERAVEAAENAGDMSRSVSYASAAIEELDPESDPERAALLRLARAASLRKLARPGAEEDLRIALTLTDTAPYGRARARVLATRMHLFFLQSAADEEARPLAEEALAIAREVGDPETEVRALCSLACLRDQIGEVDRTGDLIGQARQIAEEAGLRDQLIMLATSESNMLEGLGEHEGALQVARRGMADAAEIGLARTYGAFLALNIVEPLHSLGRWEQADRLLTETLVLDPPLRHRSLLLRWQAEIALSRGQVNTAAAHLAQMRSLARTQYSEVQLHLPLVQVGAAVSLGQGDPTRALEQALGALDDYPQPGVARYLWPVLVLGASACAELAERGLAVRDGTAVEGARKAAQRLRARADELPTAGSVMPAHRATFTGELLRTRGEPCGDAFAAAAAVWESAGHPHEQGYALMRHAEACARAGDRAAAAAALRRADDLAAAVGATGLAAQLDQLARRARLTLDTKPSRSTGQPGPGPADRQQPDQPGSTLNRLGVTAREREVLALLADGHSNRQIADRLFISPKTASVHVSNILGKLDVTSRTEAATMAVRLGITLDNHEAP